MSGTLWDLSSLLRWFFLSPFDGLPFLPLMEEKEAKEDQGVRDACQVCRVPEMVSIHALIPLYFCPPKSNL